MAIQTADRFKVDSLKTLDLTSAIEQALRANYDQNQRDLDQKILDLNWKDTKESFWLPQLSLSLQTSDQRIGRLKSGSSETGTSKIQRINLI